MSFAYDYPYYYSRGRRSSSSSTLRRLPPPQRAIRYSSRPRRLGEPSETIVLGRRRVNDLEVRSKGLLDVVRYPSWSVYPVAARSVRPRVITAPAKASAADRRFYNPVVMPNPRTVFGTEAHLHVGAPMSSVARKAWSYTHAFHNAMMVVPCIQRRTRREVMFALGYQGSHKGRRHRNAMSELGC